MKNMRVKNYLSYYLKHKTSYGILLEGEWGIGKTHFMNSYIKTEENIFPIRINLFGLSTIDEIDEIIENMILFHLDDDLTDNNQGDFQQLGYRITSKLLKIVKHEKIQELGNKYTKIVTDTATRKRLENKKNISKTKIIYIFDELERTNIDMKIILGYIHLMLEKDNAKIIVIANENKIEDKNEYTEYKDKIIGKTFKIESDLVNAYSNFVLSNKESICFKQQKEILQMIENNFDIINFRYLNQTIIEFVYFEEQSEEEKLNISDIRMLEIAKDYFLLSIKIKKCELDISDEKGFQDYKSLTYMGWKQFILNGYFTQEEWKRNIKKIIYE